MAAEVERRLHSGEGRNPSASLLSGAVTHGQLLEMIDGKADADGVYTKTETDNKLSGKAAKATTLGGYGITDAYTKTETDNKFAALPVLRFNGGIPYLCDALKDSGGDSVLDSDRNEVVSRVRLNNDNKPDTDDAYTKSETDAKFDALPSLFFNEGIPYLSDALKDGRGNVIRDSSGNGIVSRVRLNNDDKPDHDTTYTLTQDARDGHKLTLTDSDGASVTITIPDNNTTYTLSSLGIGNVKNYDQSKAIKAIARSGTTFIYTCLDGTTGTFTQQDNNTWTAMVGATASANGTAGYVPAPPKDGYNTKYLRADGTWQAPPEHDAIAALQAENALLRELINGIDAPIYRGASGNPATFADGYPANVRNLVVTIAPAQSGSGDPSPDNIRPISGVSSVSVTRTGKNLLPYPYFTQAGTISGVAYAVSTDGTVSFSGTLERGHNFIFAYNVFLKGGVTYTLSWNGTASNNMISLNVHSPALGIIGIIRPASSSVIAFTPSANTTANFFLDSSSSNAGKTVSGTLRPQLEIGAATAYEPYQGQSVTVPLVDSNNDPLTVYGGTLNVTTGELIVDRNVIDIADLTWTYSANRNAFNAAIAGKAEYSFLDVRSSCYKSTGVITSTTQLADMPNHSICWQYQNNVVFVRDLRYADAASFVAAAGGEQISYPLAEPIRYQLTPAQIAALSGYNAVTTDADMLAVTYQSNANGAKILTLTDIAAASPVPEQHRMIFGGRNLGTSVTAAQIAAVRDGSFSGLLVGDYWVINDVTWRIVDMDYWYTLGSPAFNRHHLVIMPDSSLTTAVMNETNTTTGGYVGSKMYTDTLPTVKTTCQAAFPSMVLTHRDYLVNAVTDGAPSAYALADSDVELPSEIMMYGTRIVSHNNGSAPLLGFCGCSKPQLALFNLVPRFIKATSSWFWLRDPVSATQFADVHSVGQAYYYNASNKGGVRPVFPIG